ncbi:MAG: galactosyltransferase-related protein, partial [Planctomycetota bacterium]
IDCTLVATCMGRLDDLQQSLPTWIAQPGVQIVVVDYSCPQKCGVWLEQHFPSVRVVRVSGKTYFDRSDAKNFGIQAVQTQWTLLVDADVQLHPDFLRSIGALSRPNRYLRSDHVGEGTGGTMLVETERLRDVGGHDPLYVGWGEEDDDLVDALRFAGLDSARFPARLLQHAAHGDDARMENHEADDRERTHLINRLYRTAKWDLARLMGEVPIIQQRRILHQRATTTVDRMLTSGRSATLEVDAGTMQSPPTCRSLRRCLTYVVSPQDKAASRQDKTPSRIDHR